MAYIYIPVMFDGSDWRPYGDDQWVTEKGCQDEVRRLSRAHPNHQFRVQRTRPQVLSRLAQKVQ